MRDTDIKFIYNTHLKTSRQKQDKPYKLKENFEGFEDTEQYVYCLKLKSFFDRNYIVNIEDFFIAPYEVYEEKTYYGLEFFTTMAAIKVYNIFCNKRNQLDPDNELQVKNILRGIKFMENFCIKNQMQLSEYLTHKEQNASINSFIIHLKEKNISPYNLFPFKDFNRVYSSLDFEILKFILNDIPLKLSIYRSKYYSSKQVKLICSKGLKLIEKNIKKAIEKNRS